MQATQLRTALTNQMTGQNAISRSARKAVTQKSSARPAARKPTVAKPATRVATSRPTTPAHTPPATAHTLGRTTFQAVSGREAAARSRNLEAERKIQNLAARFLTSVLGEDPDKILIRNDGFELRK